MASSRSRPVVVLGSLLALALVVVAVLVVVLVRRGATPPETAPEPGPSSPAPSSVAPSGAPSGTTEDQRRLLAQRAGFGGDVTGGAGGRAVRVTSDADSGPGTLRAALEGGGPTWVVFADDMSIRLDSGIEVPSDTTIDGRGHDVRISGPDTDGLLIESVSNVIVESLTLTGFGDTARTSRNDKPDAVHLEAAKGVWIDHNDLSETGDKLVAISGGSSAVTVSWNHFHDQLQTVQIGNQATSDDSADQTVTLHHNYFDAVGYRMPVVSYGRVHVYDNYYRDWQLYAVRSQRAAQVYLEDNVFVGGRSKRAVVTKPGGNGCNDAGTRCDTRPGALRSVGNVVKDAKRIRESDPGSVFVPSRSYRYDADPAGASLADDVSSGAGPR